MYRWKGFLLDMSDTFSVFSCDLIAECTSATYKTRYLPSQHMGYLSPDDTVSDGNEQTGVSLQLG